ncbi:MAG TPA: hypothetical protein VFN56_01525 [Candidatus Saccharimonadales bacterium]|nr:hypothetical protein [Candidatus Saccharimonadales bacterium]
MQAVNHVVAGSLLAVVLPDPVVVVPLAIASHFAMDSLPHYGNDEHAPLGSRPYFYRIVVDTILSVLIVLFFAGLYPLHAPLIILCALCAILPDLFWPAAAFVKQRGPLWKFFVLHKTIQRESRRGIWVELVWFLVTFEVTIQLVHRMLRS